MGWHGKRLREAGSEPCVRSSLGGAASCIDIVSVSLDGQVPVFRKVEGVSPFRCSGQIFRSPGNAALHATSDFPCKTPAAHH